MDFDFFLCPWLRTRSTSYASLLMWLKIMHHGEALFQWFPIIYFEWHQLHLNYTLHGQQQVKWDKHLLDRRSGDQYDKGPQEKETVKTTSMWRESTRVLCMHLCVLYGSSTRSAHFRYFLERTHIDFWLDGKYHHYVDFIHGLSAWNK